MAQEEAISETSRKLEEAQYFLNQMIANLANPKDFKNNLSAFASASRSVTFVMQSEYKIKKSSRDLVGSGIRKM
jgi:predicted DNA binding CopG/RHH family protein